MAAIIRWGPETISPFTSVGSYELFDFDGFASCHLAYVIDLGIPRPMCFLNLRSTSVLHWIKASIQISSPQPLLHVAITIALRFFLNSST